jgi:hypothetical protein
MWRKGRNHVELLYLSIVLLLSAKMPFIGQSYQQFL